MYCVTIAVTNLTFNGNCSFEKAKSCREPSLAVAGLTDLGDTSFAKKPAGQLTWKVEDWAGVLS